MKHLNKKTALACCATAVVVGVLATFLLAFTRFAPSVAAWSAGIVTVIAVATGRRKAGAAVRGPGLSSSPG